MMDDTLAQRRAEITNEWLNPDWCDWRFHIRNCKNESLWRVFYAIHSVWGFILASMGFWVLHSKLLPLWARGHRIFEFEGGMVRPRAGEGFLVLATLGIFGRAVYSTVICLSANGYGSEAANEFFQVTGFVLLLDSAVIWAVGVVYAIPRQRLVGTTTVPVHLPSPRVLNYILIVLVVFPTVLIPLFATLDGHARDILRPDLARALHSSHFGTWTVCCILLAVALAYFGWHLVKELRETARDMTSMADLHPESPKSVSEAEFRRAITTAIITLSALFSLTMVYGIVLFTFGLFRVKIQSFFPVSVLVGSCWILCMPALLTPIFGVFCYGLYQTKMEARTHKQAVPGPRSFFKTVSDRRQPLPGVGVNTTAITSGYQDSEVSRPGPDDERDVMCSSPH